MKLPESHNKSRIAWIRISYLRTSIVSMIYVYISYRIYFVNIFSRLWGRCESAVVPTAQMRPISLHTLGWNSVSLLVIWSQGWGWISFHLSPHHNDIKGKAAECQWKAQGVRCVKLSGFKHLVNYVSAMWPEMSHSASPCISFSGRHRGRRKQML